MFHSTSGISESALGRMLLVEQQENIHKCDAQIKNHRKKTSLIMIKWLIVSSTGSTVLKHKQNIFE